MAPKSRWADTEEDAALDAKIKQQKEEKRRKKAEKARKLEQQQQDAAATEQEQNDRPAKRQRISNEATTQDDDQPPKLLRFDGGSFAPSRSVQKYDKLNDIEEGTYGWVSRAKSDTGKVVALKRLKFEPAERGGLPVTGLREIQILKDCKHRNVVELLEVVVGDKTSKPDK